MFPYMLKYLRKDAGLTQTELSAALGIARSTLASYETGSREPNFEMLEVIANYFDVSMSALLGEPAASDPKQDTPTESELNNELIRLLVSLTPEEEAKVTGYIQGLMANRKD